MSETTCILNAIGDGDPDAAARLFPVVYEELRKLAAQKMAREQSGQTLQPTALVHEAWLRLVGSEARFETRAHFFSAAAEAMRRILIERARQRQSQKRGADRQRVDLELIELASPDDDEQLLLVNEALGELAEQDAMEAEVVKLRSSVGLTNEETAVLLGVTERTVRRYWVHAKVWLYDHIRAI